MLRNVHIHLRPGSGFACFRLGRHVDGYTLHQTQNLLKEQSHRNEYLLFFFALFCGWNPLWKSHLRRFTGDCIDAWYSALLPISANIKTCALYRIMLLWVFPLSE